ncbi:MAG: hypothetical protein IPJ03_16170 [Ignavibacteriales bacterium]|nr:hypothetical protein [Ignavibacteriales bacterium]
MKKLTRKQLEEENEWLWYYYEPIEKDAMFVDTKQYNKRGIVIAWSGRYIPKINKAPKLPEHLRKSELKKKETK